MTSNSTLSLIDQLSCSTSSEKQGRILLKNSSTAKAMLDSNKPSLKITFDELLKYSKEALEKKILLACNVHFIMAIFEANHLPTTSFFNLDEKALLDQLCHNCYEALIIKSESISPLIRQSLHYMLSENKECQFIWKNNALSKDRIAHVTTKFKSTSTLANRLYNHDAFKNNERNCLNDPQKHHLRISDAERITTDYQTFKEEQSRLDTREIEEKLNIMWQLLEQLDLNKALIEEATKIKKNNQVREKEKKALEEKLQILLDLKKEDSQKEIDKLLEEIKIKTQEIEAQQHIFNLFLRNCQRRSFLTTSGMPRHLLKSSCEKGAYKIGFEAKL